MKFDYGEYAPAWFFDKEDEVLTLYQLPDGSLAESNLPSSKIKCMHPIVAERKQIKDLK